MLSLVSLWGLLFPIVSGAISGGSTSMDASRQRGHQRWLDEHGRELLQQVELSLRPGLRGLPHRLPPIRQAGHEEVRGHRGGSLRHRGCRGLRRLPHAKWGYPCPSSPSGRWSTGQ
jgi:hypothetical protein